MPPAGSESDSFDEFLDRLLAGEELDAGAFVAAHPELSEADRASIKKLCRPPGTDSDPIRLPAPASAGAPIRRLGPYRLGERIGAGAMGAVFLAEAETLGRQVAVKILGPDLLGTGERAARFVREVRAVARLQHPNVVTVHAAGEHEGLQYMAMELVPGSSLHELLLECTSRGTRPPTRDVIRWGAGIARALEAAHDAGIVHRDVKPSNI